jgi:hypothetical protein
MFLVHPGRERDDFARLVAWIAAHDGRISLRSGTVVSWQETAYYRLYTNETYLVLCCPPSFCETRSEIRWLAGSIEPNASLSDALRGEYKVGGLYTFPLLDMRSCAASGDGVFGIRFGDDRSNLWQVLAYNDSDLDNRAHISDIDYNKVLVGAFSVQHLRGDLRYQHQIMAYLRDNATVSYITVQMLGSPGLAITDFMDADPPILRRGSFVIDDDLRGQGYESKVLRSTAP